MKNKLLNRWMDEWINGWMMDGWVSPNMGTLFDWTQHSLSFIPPAKTDAKIEVVVPSPHLPRWYRSNEKRLEFHLLRIMINGIFTSKWCQSRLDAPMWGAFLGGGQRPRVSYGELAVHLISRVFNILAMHKSRWYMIMHWSTPHPNHNKIIKQSSFNTKLWHPHPHPHQANSTPWKPAGNSSHSGP